MIILVTGDGKGKTTAAIGQAIRALGHGKKVFFSQFIKSDGYPSGEDAILRGLAPQLTFLKGGRGFVGILGDTLPFAEHRAAAEGTLATAREAVASGAYDLAVLDEINVAVALDLVSLQDVIGFLDTTPKHCDVVLTGRYANPDIVQRADFVTECTEIKHPFKHYVPAQQGIEF